MIIYLSPSTQERNIGYGQYGTEEKRMNELADILEGLLIDCGHTVYRNCASWGLSEVVNNSNKYKPDIHFAMHSNALNGLSRGCEIFCHKFGGNGEKLARAIYKHIEPLTPTVDRGVKEGYKLYGEGKPLYETAYTNAPAVLIEIAFHDNPNDAQWIIDNMTTIAIALMNGINDYGGVPVVEVDYKYKYDELVRGIKEVLSKI